MITPTLVFVLCAIAATNASFRKPDCYKDICDPYKVHCKCDEVCIPLIKKCPKYGFYLVGYCIKKEDNNCEIPQNQCEEGYFCALTGQDGNFFFVCTSKKLLDPCKAEPCQNGGVCTSEPNSCSFSCKCPPFYTGKLCEISVLPCFANYCSNQGDCSVEKEYGYFVRKCDCKRCYRGARCNIGPCSNVDCGFGTCEPNYADCTYTCNCRPGYTGSCCDTKINPCKNVRCPAGQGCIVEQREVDGESFTLAFCVPTTPTGTCPKNPSNFRPKFFTCKVQSDCPEGYFCCFQGDSGICFKEF